MILSIANWAEIISALICTICILHKPSVINRWFVLFLWVTVVIELVGKLTVSNPAIKIPMYNFFNGAEFFFYLMFFLSVCEGKRIKNILNICLGVFILFFLYNILFIEGLYIYNNHTHTVGAAIMIFSCLLMLFEISASETEYFTILKSPLLFVISGLLIYYAGNIFNTAMINYMAKKNPDETVKLYKLINHSINVVLYFSFCIAFLLEIVKQKKYLLSEDAS